MMLCFLFKQKTAYEMRISDWSSDVCSSDLVFQDDPGDSRLTFRRDQDDKPAGHVIVAGPFGLPGRCGEAAAGVEAAERAGERAVGEGAVAAEDLRALASDAARDTWSECGVAGRPDQPGEAEAVGRNSGRLNIDMHAGDRAVVQQTGRASCRERVCQY